MIEDHQDVYTDPIDERLFPFHLHLAEAVSLMFDASDGNKHLYIRRVVNAYSDLAVAKSMIKNKGDKRNI
ncbi:MAG: hypothetical protein WCE54_10140 [Ignavibacteriaceae bacterium]